jgi:hypothetical protein
MFVRALALALAAIVAAPSVARACATCACGDPTITTMGSEKRFAGRLRLSAEVRRRAETIDGVDVADHRMILAAAYAPWSRLILAADLPLVWRDGESAATAGPGDAAVRGKLFVLQAGRDTARHLVAVTGGVKVPTALRRANGEPVALEPGTGSVDPELGLGYGFFAYPWSVQASASALRPIGGWDDSEPAPALRSSLGVQYQPSWALAFGLAVDTRLEGDARAATTGQESGLGRSLVAAPHDGHEHGDASSRGTGALVMLAPTASTQVGADLFLSATVRVPVWRDLPTGHDEGLTVAFALVKDL